MATRVILVRHGESTYNLERRVQGHYDESVLTATGRAGAAQVGAVLQEIDFAAIYCSPFKRARETAEIIISTWGEDPRVTLQVEDHLKEINLPLWEGLSFSEVKEKYPDEYRCWRQQPEALRMPLAIDGTVQEFSPVLALYDQARTFWQMILPRHGGDTILLVAHSGINRSLINAALGLGAEQYQTIDQSNCGISVLNFSGGLDDIVQLESLNLTSHLGDPLPKPKKNKGLRMLLVRHGETDWNRQKRFQGQIDVPLNDHGRLQSQQAGAFLRDIPIDRAFTSPMLRPKETAEIILQQHPTVTLDWDDNLQEISHGLWEGKLEAEIEQEFPGLLHQWQYSPETVQMPEGENLQQVWQRAIAAWSAILAKTAETAPPDHLTTVLVVAHDAINKAILCSLAGQSPGGFWAFKQGNGAVSVIDYPKGATDKPIIRAMNITTHQGGVLDQTAAGAL